jgi:hypothetical protein
MIHSPFPILAMLASDEWENGRRPLNALWGPKKFSVHVAEAEMNGSFSANSE